MDLGLHLSSFTYPRGAQHLAADLGSIAEAAEQAGFAKLSVMDHLWQIPQVGPVEHDMLEAYTALGFLAARTSRIDLLAWVTAVVYREPGLLAKCVTSLDALSGGRAWLGIGAAWNEDESTGLGLPFPSTAERFERLEEALQIYLQMCSDSEEPYRGKHYTLGRTLSVPAPLRRPHPPILIGGGGEKKTLRLVAQYAQACNFFAFDDVAHKLEVLQGHCEAVGRDFAEIEKTVMLPFDVSGPDADRKIDELLGRLQGFAELGITHVHGSLADVGTMTPLQVMADRVVPAAATL